ncbi:hypothetical protein J4444_04625 [Candidatus Woesearchaeota archaeon]|nr:hypothetical protein [Candidatus Woesearchaeota archaeon]
MTLPCSSERGWKSGLERLPIRPDDGSDQTRDMFCGKFTSQKSGKGLVARVEMEETVYGIRMEVRAHLMEEGELQTTPPNYIFQSVQRFNGDEVKSKASLEVQKSEYFIDVEYFAPI